MLQFHLKRFTFQKPNQLTIRGNRKKETYAVDSWEVELGRDGGCVEDGVPDSLGNTLTKQTFKAEKSDDGEREEGVNRVRKKNASMFIVHPTLSSL